LNKEVDDNFENVFFSYLFTVLAVLAVMVHLGFSRSISKIIFCVADFHGQFQRYFPKGRVVRIPPGGAHAQLL
jgi:hypothetical protein